MRTSFTQKLRHKYQQYAEDSYVDLLNNPYWSADPKRKADGSLTWQKGNFSATWYVNWFDATPNYAATISDKGYASNRAQKFGSYSRHNASVSYRLFDGMDLSLMVNNVFNKMPPYDFSYPGTSSAPYNSYNFDVYGRAYYIEMRYAFGNK